MILSIQWKASVEVAWVALAVCKSTPKSLCRCLVPRWVEEWEVAAEGEGVSTASGVECQEADNEARHKASPAASNSDKMRRRTDLSPRTRPPFGDRIRQGTSCRRSTTRIGMYC